MLNPRKQQVLSMLTEHPDVRSSAVAWSSDDGALVIPGPIGMTPSPVHPRTVFGGSGGEYTPDCPLRALGYGWQLLAPPRKDEDGWDWWFVRPSPNDDLQIEDIQHAAHGWPPKPSQGR